MKIAFVVGQFPALSETFVLGQITELIDRGHEVDIYAGSANSAAKVHQDVEKYKLLNRTYYGLQMPPERRLAISRVLRLLAKSWLKDPWKLIYLPRVIKHGKQILSLKLLYFSIPFLHRRLSYDIIHCHFGVNGLRAAFLRDVGVFRGKLVTTFHGQDITSHLRTKGDRAYDQLFKAGDLFLPISDRWRQRLVELGCDQQKVIVQRMGINCKTFSFIPRRIGVDGQTRLVTVARLVEKKGVEYSIRAVAKLLRANRRVDYTVVGDGPLREELQKLIQALGISDSVKLLGWKQQEEVIEILDGAEILIAPSVTSKDGDQEGIPVSIMEAMAMGLLVVSTQHSGIPELVHDGISGFLAPERDVDALTEKLGYLIDHPEIWPKISQAGREHVEACYNNDKLGDRLVEVYKDLLLR